MRHQASSASSPVDGMINSLANIPTGSAGGSNNSPPITMNDHQSNAMRQTNLAIISPNNGKMTTSMTSMAMGMPYNHSTERLIMPPTPHRDPQPSSGQVYWQIPSAVRRIPGAVNNVQARLVDRGRVGMRRLSMNHHHQPSPVPQRTQLATQANGTGRMQARASNQMMASYSNTTNGPLQTRSKQQVQQGAGQSGQVAPMAQGRIGGEPSAARPRQIERMLSRTDTVNDDFYDRSIMGSARIRPLSNVTQMDNQWTSINEVVLGSEPQTGSSSAHPTAAQHDPRANNQQQQNQATINRNNISWSPPGSLGGAD